MDQPHLFPLSDLKTEGYAKPEPRDEAEENERDEPGAEAA